MTDALLILVIAGTAAIPVPMVAPKFLHHAKSLWLLGLLTAGIIWLAPREMWLAFIALWFLIYWPKQAEPWTLLPSLALWTAVGLTWALVLSVPRDWLELAKWGWLGAAWFQCVLLIHRKWTYGKRATGNLGSPVITALLLALVAPFCPWWGWPLLATGLVITWSWTAIVGLVAGFLVLYPQITPFLLLAGMLAAFLWLWSPIVKGRRLLEWTPRGDTVDFVIARWRAWRILWHHTTWRGHGPKTMEPALLRWGSRYGIELPWGEAHCESLHLVYEYGALGGLAALAFLFSVGSHLRFGDPWSAAFVTGVVLSLGHWPLRHVSIGLTFLAISAGVVR